MVLVVLGQRWLMAPGRLEALMSAGPAPQRSAVAALPHLLPNLLDLAAIDTRDHFAGVSYTAGDSPEAGPRSYVIFVVDCWRWDHAPPQLGAGETMPFLSGLVEEGRVAWFPDSYAAGSWTLGTVSSLLSGVHVYRHKNGARDLRVMSDSFSPSREGHGDWMPAQLKAQRGHRTLLFSSNPIPTYLVDEGFERWAEVPVIDDEGYHVVDSFLEAVDESSEPFLGYLHLNVAHNARSGRSYAGEFGDLEEIAAETGVSLADLREFGQARTGEGPLQHDHYRYGLSDQRDEHFERVKEGMEITYRWALRNADEALEQLVQGLAARGRLDDTIVFITSDHGEGFYDTQALQEQLHLTLDRPGVAHNKVVYDELTRIPLLVLGPGFHGGARPRLTSSVDVPATILADAGVEAIGLDGLDLLDEREHALVLSEGSIRNMRKLAITQQLPSGTRRVFLSPWEPGAEQLQAFYRGRRPSSWLYPWPNARSCRVQQGAELLPCEQADLEAAKVALSAHHPAHPFIEPLRLILELSDEERTARGHPVLCAGSADPYCWVPEAPPSTH